MSHDEDAGDPGLATERTALAWTRSALSLAAIGALILRAATDSHLPLLGYPVGVSLLVAAVALWVYGSAAYVRRRTNQQADEVYPSPAVLKLIAVATALLGAFALAFALAIVL